LLVQSIKSIHTEQWTSTVHMALRTRGSTHQRPALISGRSNIVRRSWECASPKLNITSQNCR